MIYLNAGNAINSNSITVYNENIMAINVTITAIKKLMMGLIVFNIFAIKPQSTPDLLYLG